MEGAIAHNLENGKFRTRDVAAGKVKSFSDIHQLERNVLNGLQRNNFLIPTNIQAAAIPMALAGMDLLVQSKSGTGKTLIYVIAAMQMLKKSIKQPQVLIIVPTRELAIQVESIFQCMYEKCGEQNTAYSFIGGTDVTMDRQRMGQSRIVIGTLGRLLHLYTSQKFNISEIKLLILDEADQLYMTNTSRKSVDQLIGHLPKRRQTIACSATYENNLDEHLAKLMLNPILISNSERATVLLGIRQFVYELPDQINGIEDMRRKVEALKTIFALLPYEQAILFANSLMRADSFKNYLNSSGIQCDLISGALSQNKRLEAFDGYRRFNIRTLVATDLMARGVDSSHANLVINLDIPRDHVNYLHRIGRAGRFGSKGIAITLLSSSETVKFKEMLSQIGTGVSVLQFPQTQLPIGFDFWDFNAYKLQYFVNESKPLSQDNNKEIDELQQQQIEDLVMNKRPNDEIETNNALSPGPDSTINAVNIIYETPDSDKENMPKDEISPGKDFVKVSLPNTNDASPQIEHDIETPSPSTDNKQHRKNNLIKSQTLSPLPLLESSIDLPPAAPNSINTKTYCLVVPTEPSSSTTLQPLGGVSNTVDDASSIISDSMECGYSSDASFVSYYDTKDERLIWSHFKIQQKLLRRHKLSARKRYILYPWHYNKKLSKKCNYHLENSNDNEIDSLLMDLDMLLPRKTKSKNFQYDFNNRPLLTDYSQLELLKKFKNWENIQRFLNIYIKKRNWSIERSWEWLSQLNETVHQLYNADTLKPIISDMPESKNIQLNTFMDMLIKSKKNQMDNENNSNKKNELKPPPPLGKLSVHVAHQLNIPAGNIEPIEQVAEIAAAAAAAPNDNDNSSDSNSSFEEPNINLNLYQSSDDGDESIEPNSSSGFDERNESASSGIDTSKYDTDSTDHYQFVDDDDDDDDEDDYSYEDIADLHDAGYYVPRLANESSASVSTEESSDTSNSDDNDEDYEDDDNDEDDNDEDDEDDNDDDNDTEDEPNVIGEAQNEWQHIFNMQYQFIAAHVKRCVALAHPEL